MNYSDRFLGILAGTQPPGNDVHIVCEALRKGGAIPEAMLPFSDDIQSFTDYYSYKGANKDACLNEGKNFLSQYAVEHEWVFNEGTPKEDRISLMKETLQYSPLGISVSAWYEKDGIYIDNGQQNNHWVMCYGYSISNEQVFWKIFDSYDNTHKILHPDHNIGFCKRFRLTKTQTVINTIEDNWVSKMVKWLLSLLGF